MKKSMIKIRREINEFLIPVVVALSTEEKRSFSRLLKERIIFFDYEMQC